MFGLNSVASKHVNSYFRNPVTTYDKYINKKWDERENVGISKQSFIKRAIEDWKQSNEHERLEFLSRKVPERQGKTLFHYFEKSSSTNNCDLMVTSKSKSSSTNSCDVTVTSTSKATEYTGSNVNCSLSTPNAAENASLGRESYPSTKETNLLKTFLEDIQPGFSTAFFEAPDLKNDKQFMSILITFAYRCNDFLHLKRSYETGKVFEKKSQLKTTLKDIEKLLSEFESSLSLIFSIKCSNKMDSFSISQTYLKRSESIKVVMTVIGKLQNAISNDLLRNLRRRVKQQNKTNKYQFTRSESELLSFCCENDVRRQWTDVIEDIISFENDQEKLCIPIEVLKDVISLVAENIVINLNELNVTLSNEQITFLNRLCPVIYASNSNGSFFINVHEFVYTPGVFEMLLFPENTDKHLFDEEETQTLETPVSQPSRSGVGGQPSMVSKFPEIVAEVTDFIKQHGFAAQARCRSSTGFSSGVSIKEIREHLYAKFPAIKSHTISLSTIRRMFEAPNKSFRASERYKALIQAKVGTKVNSYREPHADAHYIFSRNKMRREMATLFNDNMRLISMDDMAKIKVGAPAVSRYHQISKIFPKNDRVNFSDHDFPIPGYLLNVSGYLELDSTCFEPNSDIFDGLVAASVYCSEKVNNFATFTREQFLNDSTPASLVHCLCDQLLIHMNVEVNADDCEEVLIAELKKINTKMQKI